MSDPLKAGLIFLLTYVGVVVFRRHKSLVLWGGIGVGVLLGLIEWDHARGDINWNVMGIFVGTLVLSEYFVVSRVPDAISAWLIGRTRTVGQAYLAVCIFASVLSVCIENVATVLIVAPIMIGLSKRLGVSPVPGIIGIAIASNLQGAATLIGDPPSMILANYMHMNFNDFFVYHGKPGIFFAVEIGALGSMAFLYWLYNRHRMPVSYEGDVKVRSYVPTTFLALMILTLTLSSRVDPGFKWFGGAACVGLSVLCIAFSRFAPAWEHHRVLRRYDWDTTFFLAGIFVMVGMLTHAGAIDLVARFLEHQIGGEPYIAFAVIVWGSVAFSAFIDNVPYLTAMIPVVQVLSKNLVIPPELLVFGLLIGASVGGNITPVGAAANVVAIGNLKKHGIHVSFAEFARIGLPFTIAATVLGSGFLYLVWH